VKIIIFLSQLSNNLAFGVLTNLLFLKFMLQELDRRCKWTECLWFSV